MPMRDELDWVKSGGGPLICVETQIAPHWRGIEGKGISNESEKIHANDYERACSIDGYIGYIPLSDRKALILGDMPSATQVCRLPNQIPMILRTFYADSNVNIADELKSRPELDFSNSEETLYFNVNSPNFVIFDSAMPYKHLNCPREDKYSNLDNYKRSIVFDIPPGKYLIITKSFEIIPETSFLLHKFVPIH